MMRLLAAILVLLVSHSASAQCTDAANELTVDFTASIVGGSVAVPPAAVFVDAIGDYDQTDDNDEAISTAATNEMHTLTYLWDFGDPGAGTWTHSGRSKETDEGALSGHVYTTSGTKTITLTVRNSATGACEQATQQVTIADADTVYSGRTFCVGSSAPTPGSGGCPTGATAITSSDFDAALTDADKCNAGAAQVRCLFKGGDTFAASVVVNLVAGTSGGMVGSYGTGKANVTGNFSGDFGWITLQDYWTVTGLAFDRTGTTQGGVVSAPTGAGADITNTLVYDVSATNNTERCAAYGNGASSSGQPDLNAIVSLDCVSQDIACSGDPTSCASQFFIRAGRRFWLGGVSTDSTAEDEDEFNLRVIGGWKLLINHGSLVGSGGAVQSERTSAQIRGCTTGDTDCPAEGNRFVLFQDMYSSTEWGTNTFRLCEEYTCATSGGNDVSDVLIQRNFMQVLDDTLSNGAQLLGNRITFRNNVLDARGMAAGTAYMLNVESVNAGVTATSDVHVLNNTALLPTSWGSAFTVCRNSPSGSGHLCYANLAYAPSYSTQPSVGGTGWTTGQNLVNDTGSPGAGEYGENPFVGNDGSGTFPAQASTIIDYFALRSQSYTGTSPIDNGHDYSGETAFNVPTDMLQDCRPYNTDWDVGAHEYGATTCYPGLDAPPSFRGGGLSGSISDLGLPPATSRLH